MLPQFLASVDPARVVRTAGEIVTHDRWNSFDQFHETNRTLLSAYREAGCAAEFYEIPTGGTRGDGSWIIPEAEDFRDATLDLIEPDSRRLLDYRKCPWNVAQWSAATPSEGVTCELVVIDTPEQLACTSTGSLAKRLILTRLPPVQHLSAFIRTGAVGLLCDPPVERCPDAVPWTKFGWGGIQLDESDSSVIGLAISAASGDALRRLRQEHGRLVVHARVDVHRYAGSHDVVSGIILGREDPDAEIWAVAHNAEPGALDNASGVAACVEIARLINDLIRSGKLAPPRRSIRLLHGYECYGFFHQLAHVKRLQPPLAGVCIDTIGARDDLCDGVLRWHATAPASASFVNEIGATILRAALELRPVYQLQPMPFVSTEDTLLGDPKYGFPCPWITNHPAIGYHSSADTIDLIDEQGLAVCAAAMAGYLYYLADAGTDEALEIARAHTHQTINQLTTPVARSGPRMELLREQHHASIQRLKRLVWTGDHAELTRIFDLLMDQVANAAGAYSPPSRPAINDASQVDPRSSLIPIRRLPLAPTPENVRQSLLDQLGRSFPKWVIYLADGRRSVAEIASLASLENESDLELRNVIDHFEAMAALNYVELVAAADFFTEARLASDLVSLGVRRGMDLIVHSSLKSIGPVWGGADAVVDAILSALGPMGTLLAPTFNHHLARVFNPLTTPTTDGAIPEAVWRRADAKRSMHPSHSIAAIGPGADDYLRDHLTHGVWAPESPIGRLIEASGFILSIGVGHDRSTAYHLAEISLSVPCLDSFGSVDRIVQSDGQVEMVRGLAWRSEECPVDPRGLDALLDPLQSHGIVGRAPTTLARAADVFAARRAQLGDRCARCPIRPHRRNL